jgi:hypothetical protein
LKFRYGSVSDVVGDAPRIFWYSTRETRPISAAFTTATAGMRVTDTATHTYDADRRLTRIDHQIDKGASFAETFTEWDQFGRPTAGRLQNDALTVAYNDTDRTGTVTRPTLGTSLTQRFDANGIKIGETAVSRDATTETTYTIRSTATVCR